MKRLLLLLLTLASAVYFSPQAKAQTFPSYNSGDLLMGFWATSGNGASQDYLIDLGQVSQFEGFTPGQSVTFLSSTTSAIGNIDADLKATFGNNWYDDPNLYWGTTAIKESGDPPDTMYVSIGETTPGTVQAGWSAALATTQVGPVNRDQGIADEFPNLLSTTNSSVAEVQSDGVQNSWESYMYAGGVSGANTTSGNTFSYFNGSIGGAFDNSSLAAGDDPLDLYQLKTGTSPTSNYVGTFTIDDSGDIEFTDGPPAVVPEPATYGMLFWGLGALLLLGRLRKTRLQS
jgi:hypothetical protein